jgi:hypothetical protein
MGGKISENEGNKLLKNYTEFLKGGDHLKDLFRGIDGKIGNRM